jgi:hypothetical protein
MKKTRTVLIFLVLAFLCVSVAAEETYLTVKKRVRITDGIAAGENPGDAKDKAVENAKKKALERVATSFMHSYERVENGVLTADTVIQDIHAKILKVKLRKVEYPFENVALVTVDITMQYFDLDFFVRELRKSAESSFMRSIVISGWGQVYNRDWFNAALCFFTTYGSLGTAWYYDIHADAVRDQYRKAGSADAARLYNDYRNAYASRDTWLIIGIASWAYSVWEAFEDRAVMNEKLDAVHQKYFPDFYYTRYKSFVQKEVDNWMPKW